MKTSVISEEFRKRYLSNPKDPEAFEGRVVVFDGPEDYHKRLDDPSLDIDENTMLIMRGAGPDRLSGRRRSGEHASAHRAAEGAASTPCPASATAASRAPRARPPSSTPRRKPRRAAGWRCCRPATGCASTCSKGTANMLISEEEIAKRRKELEAARRLTNIPPRRRPGRKSSARMSARWAPAWCWRMRSSIRRSTRPWAFRATITSHRATQRKRRRSSPAPFLFHSSGPPWRAIQGIWMPVMPA